MNFQTIWKKSKKALALLLAITLFFGGWGNYDFSVFAAGELTVKLDDNSEVYNGSAISLPDITGVTDGAADITGYTSVWKDSKGNEVSGNVTDAGEYTLTVKETVTEKVTDPDTGVETEETKETGRDGSATFIVEKLNISECTVTADGATYTGTAITPTNVKVVDRNGAEVASSLYTVTYSNNTNAGDATITVTAATGNANIVENSSKTGTFKINKLELSGCTVTLDKDSVTYTGTAIKPTVTVTSGNTAANTAFYKVEYTNNINAGTATVTVKPVDGNDNITGSKVKNFTIAAKALADAMVTITPTGETVTGANFKDNVEVVVKDTINGVETTLTEGTDYEVEIPDMVKGDSYTIKVSGKGNYTGTIEKIFNLDYAQDGTATVVGSTLAVSAYADYVTVKPTDGYKIAEEVTASTFEDSITYTVTPDDYVVYIKNAEGKITEFTLPTFTVDTDVPTLSVTGPEADSVWAPSKAITTTAVGADYGVFYTTTKRELSSPITQAPTGMTKLEGTTLTITDSIYADTTYYFYAIDNAGHVVTAEAVVNQIEAEKPTISISGNDEKLVDDVYWKNADDLVFTVNVEDQENLSGLKEIIVTDAADQEVAGLECEFTEGAVDADGTFTIAEAGVYTLKVKDVAGNVSDSITIEVKEDTLAPQVVLAEPVGTNLYKDTVNNEYWFSADAVELPLTITDDLGADESEKAPYTVIYATDDNFTSATVVTVDADVATVPVVLTAGNEGKTTYYFKVADKAGNEGEVQQITVGYDNTQPDITEAVLTQLNGDEWINLAESGASQPNETKVAFSVSVSDAESGVKKIQYRSSSSVAWQDAVCTENNGVYTFVTNETYADGVDYVWEVRVANNVTPNMDDAAVEAVADGKIDTTAPSTTAYIRFISDTEGANDLNRGTVADGKWSSNIYEMATNAWNKIWGKETVKFEVYVQDVTSGINSIAMSYNGTEIQGLTKVDGVQAFTTGDGEDKEGYIVYEGEITHSANDSLAVQNFQIDALTDVAGNTSEKVVLGNAENTDIIYLDNVAPKLVSVQIDTNDVVTDDLYIYETTKELVLTIEERFFAQENTPVYPTVVLASRESGVSEFAVVSDASVVWTDAGVGTISLPAVAGKEMEYQVTMTYDDPSGNSLTTDGNLGVENGTFTSKIFAIDDVAPEFVSYSVAGTGCYVEDASVLKNDTTNDDLTVEFTIDDNPTYYAKSDVHTYSQENLIVKLYKEGSLVKTLQDGVDGVETLTKTVDGRNHTYSFSYDGEASTQDKFQVTVEYKDVVNHLMVDDVDTVTPGTVGNGVYVSEEYIIDHVAPVFGIEYSAATNVVKDDEGVNNGTAPLADYKAYYNNDIKVTLTFDEKYFNTDTNGKLEHFEIGVTKDDVSIETPAITWTHKENEHKAEFTIPALTDHTNDGDYQFEVKYCDCAENWMDVTSASASNESNVEGAYKSPILVMDTTAPVVTTSYAQDPSQSLTENGIERDYFNVETTFAVEVVDRNIRYQELKDVLNGMTAVNVDGDAIADTQLAANIEAIVETSVQHTNGSEEPAVWTLPLSLATEANYDIPVSYTDLAGNTAVVQFKAQDSTITDYGTEYTESVTVDKTLLKENIFIKFTGDIKGANILNTMKSDSTTDDGNWISKIFRFVSDAWMKLWGNKEIKFDIYLRDEIAGIHTITMQYLNDEGNAVPCTLTKGEDKKLIVDTEGMASEDESGEVYVVYSGSIVIDADTDLAVSQFEIAGIADKSLNTLEHVTFVDKIYLDDVKPEISIEIQDKEDGSNSETNVVEKDRYFYDKSKKMVLTIDERFFGAEDESVYPVCTLYWTTVDAENNVSALNEKSIESTNTTWIKGTDNKYSLSIDLDLIDDKEVEYYVVLSYADPAENKLVNADGVVGVEDGTFTSKTFVIDDITPELVDYSVVTTACDVQGASVLENVTSEDLVVNFTINDNPTYYKKVVDGKEVNHNTSQDNLIVQLYKESDVIATLSVDKDGNLDSDNADVKCSELSVTDREHSYSFSYNGDDVTQDKFYVTVAYKDVVDHPMIDGREEAEKVTDADDGEDIVTKDDVTGKGIYTSEMYIMDHVKPLFDITYSDATNVVKGNVDELSNRLHSETPEEAVANGKKPRVGYTAYYNTDIQVTITIDEKYENIVVPKNDGSNEVDIVDCDENNNAYPLDHYTFAITKNKAVIQPEITWSHDEEGHKASFVIKAEKDHSNDGDYQFVVTYQDCATNKMDASAAAASNEMSNAEGVYASPILVMDTTAPVLSRVAYDTINAFNTVKEKDFVNAPTTMTFTMSEKNPTPTSNYSITTLGALVADWSGVENERKTTLETVQMRNNGDEQTVSMYIEDWAGNKVVLANDNVRRSKVNTSLTTGTFTDKFTVDTVVPEIQLEYVTYTPDRPNVGGIDYFKQPITVKVTVDEHNFDEDLFKQPVVKTDDKVAYKESGWSTSGDIHVKTFTFSADNQYDLSIIGTDNAKNKLQLNDAVDMAEKLDANNSKVSVSVAVDSTIPAIGDNVKPIIVIKPGTPQNETIDGQALYNTDVTYEVVVYDPLLNNYASGINDITFKVTGEDGTAATCEVNKQGGITNGTGVTVKQVGGDVKELARGVDNKYTFNVTISSTVFNTNGIVLWVGANDVATTHNEKKVDPIAIDITKPKVVVSYDNNDVSNQKYFHDVRTATVTVTERNFSDDCLQFIVNGGDRKLDFSLSKAGSGNRDDAVWVAHYTFTADQDYTVDVEVQDRAKNVGSVEYVGEAPQEFTVDMTKPKISVEYDNHSVLNELYYKDARTATITIEEHNFDADDVIIELTAKDGGSPINTPGVSSWSSDGDYHRATIHYNYDGEFTFDIDFMDLATNEADDYDMDHFIVDLTAPELEIFDIEHMSANNGVVRPGVRYWDTNYDADGTVVVMTGYNNGIVEMTGARDITANGVEFKLDDFEYVQGMDDIYTMNATVYDLAGNSSEATVMFSVNRFGSVYTFDKETAALIGENGKYYTNKEQQLVITETNVDTLEFKEITLNLNGKLVTLKEGVDFTVSLDGNETTWKQYTYKINAENFVEEGTYILTIYSEDRATNTSDNNSKGKKIEFVVDKTNPSLLLSGIEDSGQYRTSNKEVLIDVEDNVRLSKVVVTVDGEEVAVFDAAQIDEANGRLSVSVKDSSDWQLVEVTAYDAAGNIQSHEQMRVLVSANIFVQWYRNTPLFWGSIGGTAVLAGLLWWFLIGKKKKKEDEEQQVK